MVPTPIWSTIASGSPLSVAAVGGQTPLRALLQKSSLPVQAMRYIIWIQFPVLPQICHVTEPLKGESSAAAFQ
ncbi:hypothetical protein Y1Q_0021696 [Alligator mississippiensis]|uniref:Uncharacterized protein n=1 Tax=Alligator mississippiensis TaxID=8496 RepID=A0A151PAL3_ALLMI|nr:hypothetical protein Y1Q_0021696 [Alligator mississippiensis]